MLRKSVMLILCVVALAGACRKKTPEDEPTGKPVPPVAAPAGFVHVDTDEPKVSITSRPITVGQFVEFLRETGQDVPNALLPEAAKMSDPVMGLTLDQARAYATWRMLRLPTAKEWEAALEIVGSVPYPWAEGRDGPRAGAKLHLVLGWQEGSPGELQAEQEKEELMEGFRETFSDSIRQAKEKADALAGQYSEEVSAAWQEAKPVIFELLEKNKAAVREATRTEALRQSIAFLEDIADKKGFAAIQKAAERPLEEVEAAIEAYEDYLAEQRISIQSAVEQFQAGNQALQQTAVDMRTRLERSGEALAGHFKEGGDVLAERLRDLENDLSSAPSVRNLGVRAEEVFRGLADDMREFIVKLRGMVEAPDVDAQDEEVARLTASFEAVKAKLAALDEHVGKAFLNESELLNGLDELLSAGSLKKGLEAEIAELNKLLDAFDGAEETEVDEEADVDEREHGHEEAPTD
ncbi:MAG: SUMF1/EgtB/PvdO family nonheme iron enzyme [Candidatus Brocadiia bacterium]|nr:SUMF1/EgtB/PvdO family nonheme iron enzyme [Candidatus Brocadiia bacterium]